MDVVHTFKQASMGLTLTVFEPKVPPVLPSPDSVIKAVADTQSDYVFCVPSFIEVSACLFSNASVLAHILSALVDSAGLRAEVAKAPRSCKSPVVSSLYPLAHEPNRSTVVVRSQSMLVIS